MYVDLSMGNPYKNLYAKMRGQEYSPNTRMFKVSFWAVKTDLCDTRIIHFYYTLEHGRRKKKFTFKMRNLKKTGLQRLKNRGKRIRREKTTVGHGEGRRKSKTGE